MRPSKPTQILFITSLVILITYLVQRTTTTARFPTFYFLPITRPTLSAFMAQSEAIFQRALVKRREIRQKFGDRGFFPAKDVQSFRETPWSIWDLVTPSYGCPWEMERVGRVGEGGWWVCGMSRFESLSSQDGCVIYSFGVGNDSSFEAEMLARTNCDIWGYDLHVPGFSFGPEVNEEQMGRAHFERAGIASSTDKAKGVFTIQELMRQNGHDYVDILKTDIEYSEYNTLSSLNGHTLPGGPGALVSPDPEKPEFPIGQILVEMHIFEWQGITASVFLDWWESIEYRGLRAVWREIDTVAVGMKVEDGLTRLCAYTLLNVQDSRNRLYHR